MPDFLQSSVQSYLDGLASGAPVPGGGSAAGLTGALAAGLLCMSARFTVGRERYVAFHEAATMVLTLAEGYRVEMQGLMEEDAVAYAQYGAALALPKSTDAEKAARHDALQAATRASALAPMSIAQHSFRLLELAGVLAANCNPNLVSDVAVATQLAMSALQSAVLNVRLNLKSLEDSELVGKLSEELSSMLRQAPSLAQSALETAYAVMKLPIEGV
ncbi:MAG TPA: cyclodeaminase/cyclohydrolase family protein [Armatimonadota bacterium]|jgi:formiminotetrahydrofolate cyclodeaminase